MKTVFAFVLGTLFLSIACSTTPVVTTVPPTSETSVPKSEADLTFEALLTRYTEAVKRLDPFSAPYFNIEADLDKFGDYPAPSFYQRMRGLLERTQTELGRIPTKDLSEQNLITFKLLKEDLTRSLEGFLYPDEFYDFNQMSNRLHAFLDESNPALTSFPFDTVPHYEAFARKMTGLPTYVDAQIQVLKNAIRKKIVLPCELANATPNSYKEAIEAAPEHHPFLRPLKNFPNSFSESDRKRLTETYSKIVSEVIIPQYQRFEVFYRSEYIPACSRRVGFGIGALPQGKAWYQHAISATTGLKMTPAEIHRLGLKEVARIKSEMAEIQKKLGIVGSFREFLQKMTVDPKYQFQDSVTMLQTFRDTGSMIEAKIPQYFDLIPKTPYRMVESSNPEDAAARYMDPTDTLPYGRFVVNTKNLKSTPTFGTTTLSIHEAVPGHHFHLAIQYELKKELPEYRRKLFFSGAFAEGWALYAEFLGREMGLFEDPLQKLGHLSDEMLRAVRLVVDTGIHDLGWSQKRAREYMAAHLASDAKDILNEVNRYAAWPGQAVSYKVGQLKILELRRYAEKELGSKFDLKQFHRQVLGKGTLSLSVLDSQIKKWVQRSKLE